MIEPEWEFEAGGQWRFGALELRHPGGEWESGLRVDTLIRRRAGRTSVKGGCPRRYDESK
jgi:hypothetical protein